MRRALLIVPLLAACSPDVSKPRAYACQTNAGCATDAGWYCARDLYCHSKDVGAAIVCQLSDDCASGWFCGSDSFCHDGDAGVSLVCGSSAQCGRGWHCGVEMRCYDRADAGDLPCRDDLDCADSWRCGVDRRCHPRTGAGAIACRYGTDDDCTDLWRCGTSGFCLDPAPERLKLSSATTGTPLRVDSQIPAGADVAAIGAVTSRGTQSAIITGGGSSAHVLRDAFITTTGVPFAPSPITADFFGGFGFQGNALLQFFVAPDGGVQAMPVVSTSGPMGPLMRSPDAGPLFVTTLRALPTYGLQPARLAAFQPDSGTVFIINPSPPGVSNYPVSRLIDVAGFPTAGKEDLMPFGVCWLAAIQSSYGVHWELRRDGITPARCTLQDEPNERIGDLRVGSSGVVARLIRDSTGEFSGVELDDFVGEYLVCGQLLPLPLPAACGQNRIVCPIPCQGNESVVDFHAFRSATGPAVDIACGDGMHQRWMRAETNSAGLGQCVLSDVRGTSLAVEARVENPLDAGSLTTVTAGGFNRWVRRPSGGVEIYSGNDITTATPWLMDRPPTLAVQSPLGYLVGDAELSGSISPLTGVSRSDPGRSPPMLYITGTDLIVFSQRAVAAVTIGSDGGALPIPIGRIDVPIGDWVQPIRAIQAARVDGGSEIIVTARDTVYTGTRPTGPQPTVISQAVTPSAGSTILSVASYDPADAGATVALWVATRQEVLKAYQTPQGVWRSAPVSLELPGLPVSVWTSREGSGRVGVSNGAILSLPSGLALASPPTAMNGTAQDWLEVCGVPFMMDDSHVWRLAPQPDGGAGWQQVLDSTPVPLRTGRLFDGSPLVINGTSTKPDAGHELAVFGRYGETWRVPITGCPP